jgi:hypothetical protein
MYGFWIRFPSLTGSFSLFYNAKAELLPFTVKKIYILKLKEEVDIYATTTACFGVQHSTVLQLSQI